MTPTDAYIDCGYITKHADQKASRLMKKQKIRNRIDQLRTEFIENRKELTARWLKEVMGAAFFDIKDIVDNIGNDGECVNFKKLDKID